MATLILTPVSFSSKDNPWTPTPEQCKGRRDIRDWNVMSIDPKGSQDIDDALSVVRYLSRTSQLAVRTLRASQLAVRILIF